MTQRSSEPELMDLPDSDGAALRRTLKQLGIINRIFSRSRYLLKKYVVRDILKYPQRSYTMLDLGAGGCDMGCWFSTYAEEKLKRRVRVICLDRDPRAVSYMNETVRNNPRLEVRQGEAGQIDTMGPFDFVFANHFFHHLKDSEIGPMVHRICRSTRRVFVVNDLVRSRLLYIGFGIFARIFFRHSFTFKDGLLSIRRGFLPAELTTLLADPPEGWKITVFPLFPGRVCILGENSRQT